MDLYLRKVIHPQAPENHRVILKDDGMQPLGSSIGSAYDLDEDIVQPK